MELPVSAEFWRALDALVAQSRVVIDRPKGSAHPRYPDFIYPLDYGYLDGTSAMDQGGIDVWRGSLAEKTLTGLIVTVDLVKRDSEIKLLLGLTAEEIDLALKKHNDSPYQKGLLVLREAAAR